MQSRPKISWLAVLQFAVSGLATVSCFGAAAALGASALASRLSGPFVTDQLSANMLRMAGLGLAGFLLLICALVALFQMLNKPLPAWFTRLGPWLEDRILVVVPVMAAVWAICLAAAWWVGQQPSLQWLLLPPLFLALLALPLCAYLLIGTRGLQGGSLERRWGLVAAGLTVTPIVVVVIELGLLVVFIVAAVVVVATNPVWLNEMARMAQRIQNAQADPETMLRILRPYLANKGVIFFALAFLSGVAPLLEEMLKPLPLWLLSKRSLTPAQGFVGGLICGAAFALFESIGALSTSVGTNWAELAFGRAGTGLLHTFNSGMLGWALASTWQDGRYGRLALTYLGAVLVHATWNTLSLFSGVQTLLPSTQGGSPAGYYAGMGALIVLMLFVLVRTNLRLRPTAVSPQTLDPTSETQGLNS
jgi:hypothetical protein